MSAQLEEQIARLTRATNTLAANQAEMVKAMNAAAEAMLALAGSILSALAEPELDERSLDDAPERPTYIDGEPVGG